jgi:hypothetical protein
MWWIVDVGFSHAIEKTMQLKRKRNAYILIAKLLTSFIDLWMIAYLGRLSTRRMLMRFGFISMRSMGWSPMIKMVSPRRRCMRMLSMTTTW